MLCPEQCQQSSAAPACAEAGVEWARCHAFRHTVASRLFSEGATPCRSSDGSATTPRASRWTRTSTCSTPTSASRSSALRSLRVNGLPGTAVKPEAAELLEAAASSGKRALPANVRNRSNALRRQKSQVRILPAAPREAPLRQGVSVGVETPAAPSGRNLEAPSSALPSQGVGSTRDRRYLWVKWRRCLGPSGGRATFGCPGMVAGPQAARSRIPPPAPDFRAISCVLLSLLKLIPTLACEREQCETP